MAVSFTKVAEAVVVASSTVPVVSQPVSMSGANAVQASVVVISITTGTITVVFQGSNDLENWSAVTTSNGSALGIGYHAPSASGIAWQYIRVTYLNSTSATAVVSCGVATAEL